MEPMRPCCLQTRTGLVLRAARIMRGAVLAAAGGPPGCSGSFPVQARKVAQVPRVLKLLSVLMLVLSVVPGPHVILGQEALLLKQRGVMLWSLGEG